MICHQKNCPKLKLWAAYSLLGRRYWRKCPKLYRQENFLSKYSRRFRKFLRPRNAWVARNWSVGQILMLNHMTIQSLRTSKLLHFLGIKSGIYQTEPENRISKTSDEIWIRMKDAPKRCFMPYWIYRWVVCFAVSTFFKNFKISCWTWIFILNFNLCQKHQSFVNGKYHSFQLEWQYRDFWLKVNKHRWKNSFHSPCDFQTGFLSDDFFLFFQEPWKKNEIFEIIKV